MTSRDIIRAAMVRIAYDAIKGGSDGAQAVLQAMPGCPEMEACLAAVDAQMAIDEEWWQGVDATIDAAAVKAAFTALDRN